MKSILGTSFALTLSLLLCGCAGTSSMKNLFASKTPVEASADPLSNIKGDVSEEFQVARKELDAPEATMLQFARWREDMGDHVEAMNRYREILKANDQCVEARLGIARVEQATGRIEAASKILDATARLHPERSDVWISMGQLQASQKNYPAAIEHLKKAVELNSQDQAARYELGLAYARSGQVDLAHPHLAFAVGQSAACYNIGFVLNEANRPMEAVQWLERAVAGQPDERTLNSSRKMLASIRGGSRNSAIARQAPPKVDVELTSYEAYRETPAVTVEPRAKEAAAPQQNPGSVSPFRNAVQTRTIADPDQSLRSAMSALAGQAGNDATAPFAVQPTSGRVRVDSVPTWGGPSAANHAVPMIQNQQSNSSSYVEPQDWSAR